eukprot:360946-Chlamydomonas_euryale.AAC.9
MRLHDALPFHVHFLVLPRAVAAALQQLIRGVRDLDAARLTCRLHARRCVHAVAKDGELGQARANQARRAGAGVHADPDLDKIVVVRHAHLQGGGRDCQFWGVCESH